MPPPPPPPPSLNKLNNNSIKSSKKEPTDVNALLSQIRQGAKLKKVKNVNDRSSPIIAGSVTKKDEKSSKTQSITPSMFKNGAVPLNINFKIPQFGNHSAVKVNKPNTTINTSTIKSPTNYNNQNSYTKTLPSKFSTKNNSDRPSIKPPPLPIKPPGIDRRQSFDSGQIINALNSLNSSTNSSTNSSVTDTNNGIKTNNVKPLPPPRNTNISFQTIKQAPAPPISIPQFKSTQNLTTLNSNNPSAKNNMAGFSTLRVKTNGKNYTSTPRPPIGPPPPPPINKNNNKAFLNNQSNNSISLSSLQISSPLAPAPPPPPSSPPPPPPPSSLTLASMGNLNSYNNSNYNTIEPMTVIKNSSKDLESRFHKQFRDITYLPAPEPFTNCKKIYSASLGKPKFKQRSRAPDPPNFNQTGFSTPILNF